MKSKSSTRRSPPRCPPRRKTGGRKKGTPNIATVIGREALRKIAESPNGLAKILQQYEAGKLKSPLVKLLWAYAWGAPPKKIEVTGKFQIKNIVDVHEG